MTRPGTGRSGTGLIVAALVALSLPGCSLMTVAGEELFPTRPKIEGTVELDGLGRTATIVRDENGMAYIHARGIEDLYFAQGFAMSQDRLFQMDLARRQASGRLSELAGEIALPLDRLNRTLGFRRVAEEQRVRLAPDLLLRFEAFAAGVNAYITEMSDEHPPDFELADLPIEPWSVIDSLAITYQMGFSLSADMAQEILLHRIFETVGPERALELEPPLGFTPFPRVARVPLGDLGADPLLAAYLDANRRDPGWGSNNWATSGARSASGRPVVANDPHLAATMVPGPVYPVGFVLDDPDRRAVGVAIPGTPGIVIGRNRVLAWGMTNNYGDVQDLYVETLHESDPGLYREGEKWEAFDVVSEVIRVRDDDAPDGMREEPLQIRHTVRGPLISDALSRPAVALSLRWAAREAMRDGAGDRLGLDELWLSATVEEFMQHARDTHLAPLNLVWAHRDGAFGWHVVGRVPRRVGHDGSRPVPDAIGTGDWRGWIPFELLPQERSPARGWTGTANHRTVDGRYPFPYSAYASPPWRFQRMGQLLDGDAVLSPADHRGFQEDAVSLLAQQLVPIFVAALRDDPESADLAEMLEGWNGELAAAGREGAVYHAIWRAFLHQVFVDELGEELSLDYLANPYAWQERMALLIQDEGSHWFDDTRTPERESRDDLLRRAAQVARADLSARLGEDADAWTWGELHRLELLNPLGREGSAKSIFGAGNYPMSGDGETLLRARYAVEKGQNAENAYRVNFLAGLRMVADLGDDCVAWGGVPAGVSGRWTSDHYADQTERYLGGEPVEWWLCAEQLDAHTTGRLVLEPAPEAPPAP